MEKYSTENAKLIVDMLRTDTYTINELCAAAKICKASFYNWQRTHPLFAEMVNDARKELNAKIINGAKKSLWRKITGYDSTETRVTMFPSGELDANGKPIGRIKSETKITRHVEPDITAIIFTLTSLQPDVWKRRKEVKIAAGKERNRAKELTDDQLERTIAELKTKLSM